MDNHSIRPIFLLTAHFSAFSTLTALPVSISLFLAGYTGTLLVGVVQLQADAAVNYSAALGNNKTLLSSRLAGDPPDF